MPRYFMHLRDGSDIALDEEGAVFAGDHALRNAVIHAARDCISNDVRACGSIDFRLRIDAENEAGDVVYSLRFDDAVTIIAPDTPPG